MIALILSRIISIIVVITGDKKSKVEFVFSYSFIKCILLQNMKERNRIEIKYYKQCNWLMRSAWMAQELLTTFQDDIDEVAIVPGSGGIFEVLINDETIWSRKEKGRFPDIKELKQLVRDQIAPDRNLGHTDR